MICLFGVQGDIFMVIICVGRVLHHPSFYLYKKKNTIVAQLWKKKMYFFINKEF